MGLWQSENTSDRQGFVGLWESSDALNPTIKIPLITSANAAIGNVSPTFTRNSTATYIDKDGVLQTAGINVIRFQNGRYLCEPAATNLFLQSGAPATQVITVVSGTVYTVQCYGSGSITLSGAGTGSVIEGTPITFTASSTSLICAVSGSLNRAQVETGTQATSYIPTTSATVTRAADALHYTVGSDITQRQGSLYCEFWDVNTAGAIRVAFSLSDGTASNKIWILIDAVGGLRVNIKLAGVNVMYSAATSLLSTLNKVLITYQDNLSKIYVNGVLVETDTTCIIPIGLSKLHIGVSETSTYHLNSGIGNVKYFKEVLTEAQAIKLTTL